MAVGHTCFDKLSTSGGLRVDSPPFALSLSKGVPNPPTLDKYPPATRHGERSEAIQRQIRTRWIASLRSP